MRKPLLPCLVGVLALMWSACSNTTEPRVFSIAGTWESVDYPGATIEMTLVETARAINGAGHWITPGTADAFRASGASVGETASLLFDFDGREDVNFQATFSEENDTTFLSGSLFGAGLRGESITFRRTSDE